MILQLEKDRYPQLRDYERHHNIRGIVGPRQSGKTTKLIEEMEKAYRNGKKIIFVCVNLSEGIRVAKLISQELLQNINIIYRNDINNYTNALWGSEEDRHIFIDNIELFSQDSIFFQIHPDDEVTYTAGYLL